MRSHRSEQQGQNETFQGESGMSPKTNCEDEGSIQGNQEVPVVLEDRKAPSMPGDQEVPFGQMDQDRVNSDAGQDDEAAGQGDEVVGQGDASPDD